MKKHDLKSAGAHPQHRPCFKHRPLVLLLGALFCTPAIPGDLKISQLPLMIGGGQNANIMILIDNSFNMASSQLPTNSAHYGPTTGGSTSLTDYGRPHYGHLAIHSVYANKLAYDPKKKYSPPQKADGTPYPNQIFTAADKDGFGAMPNNGKVNLSTWYQARAYGGLNFFVRSMPRNDGRCTAQGVDGTPGTFSSVNESGVGMSGSDPNTHCSNNFRDPWPRSAFYTWFDKNRPGCVYQVKDTGSTANLNDASTPLVGRDISQYRVYNIIDLNPVSSERQYLPAQCNVIEKGVRASSNHTSNPNGTDAGVALPDDYTGDGVPTPPSYNNGSWCSTNRRLSIHRLTGKHLSDNHQDYANTHSTNTPVAGQRRHPYNIRETLDGVHQYRQPFQQCFEIVEVGSARDQELSGMSEAEAKTNFANWYSYYGTRVNLLKSSVSKVLHGMDPGLRIGFGVTGGGTNDTELGTSNCHTRPESGATDHCVQGRAFVSQAYKNGQSLGTGRVDDYLFQGSRGGVRSYLAGSVRIHPESIAGITRIPHRGNTDNDNRLYSIQRGVRPFVDYAANEKDIPEGYKGEKFRTQVFDYLFSFTPATIRDDYERRAREDDKVNATNNARVQQLSRVRRALGEAGEYFRIDEQGGPWSVYPGIREGAHPDQKIQSCRKSYTLLVTAGPYENDSIARYEGARGDQDSSPGQSFGSAAGNFSANNIEAKMNPIRHGTDPRTAFLYIPRLPFADTFGRNTNAGAKCTVVGGAAVAAAQQELEDALAAQAALPPNASNAQKNAAKTRVDNAQAKVDEKAARRQAQENLLTVDPTTHKVKADIYNTNGSVNLDKARTAFRNAFGCYSRDTNDANSNNYGYENTLADVAMAYWKNDLLPDTVIGTNPDGTPMLDKPDFANNVSPTAQDPIAFWQNMNTIVLQIGDTSSITATLPGTMDQPAVVVKSLTEGLNSEDFLLLEGSSALVARARASYTATGLTEADGLMGKWGYLNSGDGRGGSNSDGWGNPTNISDHDTLAMPQSTMYGNDLLHAGINSFGGYYSVNSPEELSKAMQQVMSAIQTTGVTFSSLAGNAGSSGRYPLLYQPLFSSQGWYSQLKAFRTCTAYKVWQDKANARKNNGTYTDDSVRSQCREEGDLWTTPDWDAAFKLTEQLGDGNPTAVTGRKVYSSQDKSGGGIEFTWNALSQEQQKSFYAEAAGETSADGMARLNYLRGETRNELSNDGAFRDRTAELIDLSDGNYSTTRQRIFLGDIVNSGVVVVGNDDFGFSNAPALTSDLRNAYRKRKFANAGRVEVIYTGANDGMLHAFDGRPNESENGEPNSDRTKDGGQELFAYVPNNVFPKLFKLTETAYLHEYYVDGPITVSDAVLDPKGDQPWRTVLIGSTGAGGRAYFALDVEDPENFSAENVLWEIAGGDPGFENLGVAIGRASIGLLNQDSDSGTWVAVFGNGYNSRENGKDSAGNITGKDVASLLIVDLKDGKRLAELVTPSNPNDTTPNGLSTPILVDVNRDGAADLAYAGDLRGNLWKFDLRNLSGGRRIAGSLILKATDDEGNPQPITAQPDAAFDVRNPRKVMVYVGTGKFLETGDQKNIDLQTFYGVRDCGIAANCTSTTFTRGDLLAQTIEAEERRAYNTDGASYGETVRRISQNTPAQENNDTSYKGFYIDLAINGTQKKGERMTAKPIIWSDRVIFNTIVPGSDECKPEGSGFLYEANRSTGGRLGITVFDLDHDGSFGDKNDLFTTGEQVSGKEVGMGGGITTQGSTKYVGNIKGRVSKTLNNTMGTALGRKGWWKIR